MVSARATRSLLAGCLLGCAVGGALCAFAVGGRAGSPAQQRSASPALGLGTATAPELPAAPVATEEPASSWQSAVRLASGLVLGALLLIASGTPARADLEDTPIPLDDKGKTVIMSKEEIIRGKRLFNAACASCHVGGGTRTNQNVGLGLEELSGSQPPRNNIESLIDYQNAPTTYDGLKDISEVHPSIKAGDVWPKMRSMKQKDLYDISSYILYQNFTIPEKWGGGKQYY
uniref:Cytochrome c domain-containing protein n=1 Tax=Alexandrium catenella TaxID=2925 RepID=A0A7S1WM08_ALECA